MDKIVGLIPLLLVIVGVLVVLTNIIVEVLKKLIWDKMPTNFLAVIVALVLTLVAFFAFIAIAGIPFVWYYLAAAIVVGFMVAYAAMLGFDKLCEALEKLKELRKLKELKK